MSRPAICPHCGAKRGPEVAPLKVGEDDRRELHKLISWLVMYAEFKSTSPVAAVAERAS